MDTCRLPVLRRYPLARRALSTLAAAALVLAVAVLGGCSSASTESGGPAKPVAPAAPKLDTPENAVRSYLDWTSFAYRMANSDAASATCTPEWGVHVDSYIQLNREQGNKTLEQWLRTFEKRSESIEGTRAVLAASEQWDYRYFSLDDQTWVSPPYSASYDTTYTLVKTGAGWLVDDVSATPLTEVK